MELSGHSCYLEDDCVIRLIVNHCYLVAVNRSNPVGVLVNKHIKTTVGRRCDRWYLDSIEDFNNDVSDGAFVVLNKNGVN